MPKFTLLVAFRNRDIPRVTRFLTSLRHQSFTDFEVLFLDYGSDEPIASQAAELCSQYEFCTYTFLNTAGKYWNKCIAFNVGIQLSKGEYIICTDIDMIFSEDVLAAVNDASSESNQVYSRIYLLPKDFTSYDSLHTCPTEFSITGDTALGGLQCVHRSHFLSLRGFDEYYCIWGLEDLDMARRFEHHGLETTWISHAESPIYHQWHPRISVQKSDYPDAWWDDMNHHFVIQSRNLVRNSEEWGKLSSPNTPRPAMELPVHDSIEISALLNPFERSKILGNVLNLISETPGRRVQINCIKTIEKGASGSFALNKLNSVLLSLGLPVKLINPNSSRRQSGSSTMHHFLLTLLNTTEIVGDYSIIELPSMTQFNIVANDI